MFAFWLGREYKLSVAELWAVFPKAVFQYIGDEICILSGVEKASVLKIAPTLWGTIKIMELIENYQGNPSEMILEIAQKSQGKFQYAISVFWQKKDLKRILINTKNLLKKSEISSRFVNKDFKNLSSAQIIGERLVEKETDFSIIDTKEFEYFGKSIWVQDIENYGKRDFWKTRDMDIGMLPPKLAQMMLHFSGGQKIYDPFVWLGTVLIESILMGNSEVYGSDINPEMVQTAKKNIVFTTQNFSQNLKKYEIIELDARGISSSSLLKFSDAIVSEGYLGQVFQKYSITEKKVSEEREKLLKIYSDFFFGLKKVNYKWVIVISFPFWEIRGKYVYFSEVYELIQKYCKIEHMLPFHPEIKHTKTGSLLYKRTTQIVGREIYKLTIK